MRNANRVRPDAVLMQRAGSDPPLDDAAQARALLGQVEASVATVTADGAYDSDVVYQAATRQLDPSPESVAPPRVYAVPSTHDPAARIPWDRHIQLIAEQGRMEWQRVRGYGRRSFVKTASAATST